MTENQIAYQKEKAKREERRAKGLCVKCGLPNDDMKYKNCSICRKIYQERKKSATYSYAKSEKGKKRAAERYQEKLAYFQENNLCTRCGGERDEEGYNTCSKCRAKNREVMKLRYMQGKSKPPTEEQKKKASEVLKAQRQEREAKGLCYACGERPATGGYKTCTECRDKQNQREREIKEYRIKNNLCIDCNAPTYGVAQRCVDCREKRSQYTARYRKEHKEQVENYEKKYRKIKYKRYKDKGLCSCGGKTLDGYRTCPKCLENQKRYSLRNRRLAGKFIREDIPYQERKNCCIYCGSPVKEGYNTQLEKYSMCEKCYQQHMVNLSKRRKIDNSNHPWRQDDKVVFARKDAVKNEG